MVAPKARRDLLGRALLGAQLGTDEVKEPRPSLAPGHLGPQGGPVGPVVRRIGPIGGPPPVVGDLAADGAAMASEVPRHGGVALAPFDAHPDLLALSEREGPNSSSSFSQHRDR